MLDLSLRLLEKEEISKPIWFRQTFWRYAAAVIILLSGLRVYQQARYTQRIDTSYSVAQAPLQQVAPELAPVEAYYTSLISQQRQLLNDEELKNLGLGKDFERDLATLDSAYAKLKKDLYKDVNKEQITNAMIQNLQMRADIIGKQIQTLNQIKKYQEKKHYEKTSTSI